MLRLPFLLWNKNSTYYPTRKIRHNFTRRWQCHRHCVVNPTKKLDSNNFHNLKLFSPISKTENVLNNISTQNQRMNYTIQQNTELMPIMKNVFQGIEIKNNCIIISGGNEYKTDHSIVTRMKLLELKSEFPEPFTVLSKFYSKLAYELNDSSLSLKHTVTNTSNVWVCFIHLEWPEKLRFLHAESSKHEAIAMASLDALNYLKDKNLMNNEPKLNGNNNNGTIFNFNLLPTTSKGFDQQVRNYSTSEALGIKKRGRKRAKISIAEIVDNDDVTENEKPDVQNAELAPSNDEITRLRKSYPHPKNVLHSMYAVLAQELKNKSLIVSPQYQNKSKTKGVNSWMCTYHLKWPEDVKFVHTAKTKQEASDKAALLALRYLKQNDKMENGHLKTMSASKLTEIKKQSIGSIKLKPKVQDCMNRIVESYENDMVPLLVKSMESMDMDNDTRSSDAGSTWPELVNRNAAQHYKGLHYYLAREPVNLPISKFKEHIIDAVQNNQVVIVKGEPGCGKSTRVPQYVLEGWAKGADVERKGCRIVITQPRRIAAISLAERVACERQERVGETVGYQVRLKSNFNRRSGHMLFCTTGILLRRLQSDPTLSDCSHIILDEAHERDVNTDLLLNLMRHAINKNPNLKLLVMSATIDAEVFQAYFEEAAVIHIPGFTYPVKVNFLDETKQLDKTMKMCETNAPFVVHDDVVKLVKFIHRKREEGAILVFLPGWDDIAKIRNLLSDHSSDMYVLCLHSRMQDEDQRKIYSKAPPGVRKVILATNIAETSVTIDDVAFIIDSGIQKEQRFDVEKGIVIIDNHWISKASMAQRKGRAGRVAPGESFHLYPESKYKQFSDYSIPEILRTSLTKIVLDSKVFSNNAPATEFLGELLSPPAEPAIISALDELKSLELLDSNENLKPLGRVLSNFQLEPKLGKAMVNSVIYKCVTPIVDMVTLFSAETELFTGGLSDKESINKYKKTFSQTSDHLSMMRVFEKWLEYMENEDYTMADRFCMSNNLVNYKLGTIRKLRDIHFEYLEKGLHKVIPIADDYSDNDELVKAVMLSGVGTVLQHRNYDVVKGRIKKANILLTRHNHKATITSDSVNFKRFNYPSDYLLYINETRSNIRRITVVRETSLISPIALLLFKNNTLTIEDIKEENFLETIPSSDQVILKLEGTKIECICDRQDALLIKKCKDALNSGSQYYIYQLTKGAEPNKDLNLIWDDMLQSLSNILEIEAI